MSADLRAEVQNRLQSLVDERLDGLSRRIQEWLAESNTRAEALSQIMEEARLEPVLLDTEIVDEMPASGGDLRAVATFAQEVESLTDQVAILGRLVSAAATQAGRVLLFVVRNERLMGWEGQGFPEGFSAKKVTVPSVGDSLLSHARGSCVTLIETPWDRAGNEELAGTLGIETPERMMASPLWVRDRVAAVLYADALGPADAWSPDAIRLIASLAGLSLEAIPARMKYPRPNTPVRPHEVKKPAKARDTAQAPLSPTQLAEIPATEEIDPEEARHHEDARRFARLLVSEILLYNEKEIEEGRLNKDLYERLKEDIDRSRQMYQQRAASQLPGGPDYFRQELIRTLANGDESALSIPWD